MEATVSHYLDLSDEDRIKIARDAVKCSVPISPVIAGWLHEQGLHDRIANPRKTNAEHADQRNEPAPSGQGETGVQTEAD